MKKKRSSRKHQHKFIPQGKLFLVKLIPASLIKTVITYKGICFSSTICKTWPILLACDQACPQKPVDRLRPFPYTFIINGWKFIILLYDCGYSCSPKISTYKYKFCLLFHLQTRLVGLTIMKITKIICRPPFMNKVFMYMYDIPLQNLTVIRVYFLQVQCHHLANTGWEIKEEYHQT